MKLSVALGVLALLPHGSWAAPVASSPAAGITTLAEAQRGLVFGGFFTLYSFAVASPAVPAVIGLPSSTAAPVAWPTVANPAAVDLADDGDGVADTADLPIPLLIAPGPSVLAVAADEALLLPRPALPGVTDAARPGRGLVLPAATAVPEPSTLLLVALAGLALLAAGRKAGSQQPAVVRR